MGRRLAASAVAITLAIAPATETAAERAPQAAPGGVYRTEVENFGFTGGFDPTGEYLYFAWGLYSQLLLRTLVTYPHVAGPGGAGLFPDLATDLGEVSADGLTYTFTLKLGIRFGPPVSRPITSQDIEYAFARIDAASLVAQYGFYYDGTIVGMELHSGPPRDVPGIETPDDRTIVFHLVRPTGDFLHRLAMPATAPIPPEVGKCFDHAGDYGRDVVSTGPYMIQGAEQVNISSCAAIELMSGFDPARKLILVRNPDYDPSTDHPSVRHNFIDGVDIRTNPNVTEIYRKIEAGLLNGSIQGPPPRLIVRHYLADPKLRRFVHVELYDRTYYISMNLLVPPFDDVHVRRAVNWAIDKASLQRSWGGPTFGEIATHPDPPNLLGGLGQEYDPYATPGHRGDLERAKAEMMQSAYDQDHDGVCDDPVCLNVTFVNRNTLPQSAMTSSIVERLAAIGIQLHPKLVSTAEGYAMIQTVTRLVPITAVPLWGKDYFDPSTFGGKLFHSHQIDCFGQVNYSEVGMTARQAWECGVLAEWRAARPPSIDQVIESCLPLAGPDRLACWTKVQVSVMEDIVPWVPYIWSSNILIVNESVARYEFDQFAAMISLCHISLR